jgi:NADPH-dependent curcumin reductase CurA
MLPKTYRKVIATRFTNQFHEAAQIVEVPMPELAANEILVRNRYAGINATDVNISAGSYTPNATPPIDLGAEAVGEVAAVGSEVTQFKVGDAALTNTVGCGYREYATMRAYRALPVPEASPEIMSMALSGTTASIGLNVTGDMKHGETVLVTAAAGGTGQFAVQLAKLAGNHVVGTCGSDEKAALLRSLGCDRVINYRKENVGDVLRTEYPHGINLIYESVGREMFDVCVDHLAIRGRLVIIGYITEYLSTPEAVTAPRIYFKLLGKSASVHSMFLPHYFKQIPEHLSRLLEFYGEGTLKVAIDPTEFRGVESVVDAVAYLHSGQSQGKVVVRF